MPADRDLSRTSPTAAERPPGPRTVPFIGNLVSFARDPFGFRERCIDRYGDVVDISALGQQAYLCAHPDTVERVLLNENDRFEKPGFEMRFVDDVFGRSIPFIQGEAWRRRRHLLQPSFFRDRIVEFSDTMARVIAETVAEWDDRATISLHDEMKRLTLRVLVSTLFGLDGEADDPELLAAFAHVKDRQRIPQVLIPEWVPTRTNRRYRAAVAHLETAIDDVIERRRREIARGDEGASDLLATLLQATDRDELGTERLRDEVLGFLFAGYETTAVCLTFTWLLLADNPDVRERLQTELRSATETPFPQLASTVPLLDRVLSESLRLYPPSHSIARQTGEDVTIRRYEIPAGASIHLPQWVVHRDDRWYDDPETFDPERWRDDRAASRPEYAFFPFGGGPRQCIGMRFARLELQIAMATILRSVTIVPETTDPELEAGLTLRPANPIDATVRMEGDPGA